MPKLPRLTGPQVLKILKQRGFIVDHVTGSHYILYNPLTKRRAVVPYHTKNLPLGTLKSILREAEVSIE